jgi:hypothetical protein
MWTTHDHRTARETFNLIASVIESSPELSRQAAKIKRTNGDQEITLIDGSRLMMRARGTRTSGYTATRLIIHEADSFTERHAAELIPNLAGRVDPQVVYGYAP